MQRSTVRRILVLAFLLTSTAAFAFDDDCEATAARALRVPASGITHVVVIGKAGSLRVTGRDGAAEIRADGTACASRSSVIDDIRLVGTRVGSEYRIEAITPEDLWWGSASLSFEVTLPAGMAVDVRDGSGDLAIVHTGQLHVVDGSGDLEIRDVRGNVDVRDGSGDTSIRNVSGNVSITDGSGDLTIEHVGGSVTIPADGSGGAEIRDVRHDVMVEAKGSGSLEVDGVGGDLTVQRKGGGSLDYAHVSGRVNVPERWRH